VEREGKNRKKLASDSARRIMEASQTRDSCVANNATGCAAGGDGSSVSFISGYMRCSTAIAGDQKLIQIVDAALAEATSKSGNWLVCRAGCTQCCMGVFAINQLDALRLRQGLADLETRDAERAARIRVRALEAVARLSLSFPGNPTTGVLDEGAEAEQRFANFANEEPCPVLDPETGLCELYESRPMTCRVFGPPVRSEDGLGVCELCYHGASDEEIAACEMKTDFGALESRLLRELQRRTGARGETIIAFCLASSIAS